MVKITSSKKRLLLSIIVLTILTGLIIAAKQSYFTDTGNYGTVLLMTSFVLDVLVFASIILDFDFSDKVHKRISAVGFFLMPLACIAMVECLNGVWFLSFSPLILLGNYLVYLGLFGILYVLIGKGRIAIRAAATILLIFGIVNYFVETFRGTPFQPLDIVSWKTALNVSSAYTFALSYNLVIAIILYFLIFMISGRLVPMNWSKRTRLSMRLGSAGVIAVLLCSFYMTDLYADNGIKPDFWNQLRGYRKTGAFTNFFMNTKYLFVSEPKGYSSEAVASLASAYAESPEQDTDIISDSASYSATSDSTGNTASDPAASSLLNYNTPSITAADLQQNSATLEEGEQPNIVVIMNETLSDLSVLGDFETNQDYMPFLRSLKGSENAITGNLYMSVNGAGTCNSEFEFLTGNSMAFLPSGSTAYSLYVKDATPSLVSTLEDQGYDSEAFHTYYGSGWNREDVYQYMGFDDFISLEDLIPEDKLEEYKDNESQEYLEKLFSEYFPGQSDALLRKYPSDALDYRELESLFEHKDENSPLFLFNVTMQNHGGYTKKYNNFYQSVWLTGDMKGKYPKTDQYLSLIKKSDDAFADLLTYFSQSDEPTIVVMFGDHQPSVEDEFYEEVMGKSLNSLTTEEDEKRYITPFVIWANYDINEGYYDKISANYLSCLVSEVAGAKQTEYNQYLSGLYKELPVINAVGYCDSEGNWYNWDEDSPYKDDLKEYQDIQYNNLFDTENRQLSLFYLDGSETKAELQAEQDAAAGVTTADTSATSTTADTSAGSDQSK